MKTIDDLEKLMMEMLVRLQKYNSKPSNAHRDYMIVNMAQIELLQYFLEQIRIGKNNQ